MNNNTEKDKNTQAINYKEYLVPIWEGLTVYDESILPMTSKENILCDISLIYPATKILSVKSSDLTKLYVEGIDYILRNGKLHILPNSSIPITNHNDLFFPYSIENKSFKCSHGGFIFFSEGSFFHSKQILVSYTHTQKWNYEKPQKQGKQLVHIKQKLENKVPVNIVFYGDSISVGANSSGFVNSKPFLPTYSEMVMKSISSKYKYDKINYINTSVGGMNSQWGKDNADALVAQKKPDLLFIGFGMNDVSTSNDDFYNNIQAIINTCKKSNKDCDIVLISPMLPNMEALDFYGNQLHFIDCLNSIKNTQNNIAVADLTTIHSRILEVKNYQDITGNNINHPNDFLTRIYAQVILTVMDL